MKLRLVVASIFIAASLAGCGPKPTAPMDAAQVLKVQADKQSRDNMVIQKIESDPRLPDTVKAMMVQKITAGR